MKRFSSVATAVAGVVLMGLGAIAGEQPAKTAADSTTKASDTVSEVKQTDIQAIPFETITGDTTSLADFAGSVALVVNVASKCGHTPQYKGLEELYERFKDSGFTVIGFPANNFKQQEPGTNEEILKFCTSTYGVTFPMMSKISVKGPDQHPLYTALTTESDPPGEITWNFNKFLISRDGKIIARFDTKVEPLDPQVIAAIEKAL